MLDSSKIAYREYIALRAMTKGFGSFEFNVTGYEVVPRDITAKVAAAAKR